MNPLSWLNPAAVLVEATPGRLRVFHHENVREWPLRRGADGRYADLDGTRNEIAAFLDRKPWQPHLGAICALPASGVSLRSVRVPRASDGDLEAVLRLQIESSFPLAPDELAWGWLEQRAHAEGRDVLLAAVKREGIEDLRRLLEAVGLRPAFTLGAVARTALAEEEIGPGSFLHFGGEHTEWLGVDASGPQRLRVVPWGEQRLLRELVVQAGLNPEAAAAVLAPTPRGESAPVPSDVVRAVLSAGVEALLRWVPVESIGPRLHVSGPLADSKLFLAALAQRIGDRIPVTCLETSAGNGRSTTLRGLRRMASRGEGGGVLELRHRPPESSAVLSRPAPRKWAIAAGVLLLAGLALPYAEAYLLQPGLAARIATIRKREDDLKLIDRQSDFLRYLKQNQAPTFDVLTVLGKCLPQGGKLDGFNLNRKGELSIRVTLRQPPEAATFRTKVTESGLFSSVVIEEQAPGQNRQGLALRLSAQIKAANERASLKILAPDPVPGGATNKVAATNAPVAGKSGGSPTNKSAPAATNAPSSPKSGK